MRFFTPLYLVRGVRTTHAWRLGVFNPACHSGWLLYDNTKVCLLVESVSLPLHYGNTGTGLSQEYSVMGPTPVHSINKQTNDQSMETWSGQLSEVTEKENNLILHILALMCNKCNEFCSLDIEKRGDSIAIMWTKM